MAESSLKMENLPCWIQPSRLNVVTQRRDSNTIFDRSRTRNRLGSLRVFEGMVFPALWTCRNLGIVVGHFLQKR
jgi:hypothetical protein